MEKFKIKDDGCMRSAKKFKSDEHVIDKTEDSSSSNNNRQNINNTYYTTINEFDKEFLSHIDNIEEDSEITMLKCSAIIQEFENEISNAGIRFSNIEPFGSSITSLANEDSDVDIYVHFERKDETLLSRIRDQLLESRCFTDINFIKRARVPVIKCYYIPTSTMCDISASSINGCYNSKLIKFYFQMDLNIRRLVFFLKHWLKVHDLQGTRKIVTYALSWLAIFYLQTLRFVPNVHQLQTLTPKIFIINGWNVSFNEDRHKFQRSCIKDFRASLLGFFRFYANFDYQNYIISPYIGELIALNNFRCPETIPSAFKRYKDLLMKGAVEPMNLNHYCFLQDPFEHNTNIIYQTSYNILKQFQEECCRAVEILENTRSPKFALQKLLYSPSGGLIMNELNNSNTMIVDIKMSKLNLTANNKKDFLAVFNALHYVLQNVYKCDVAYDNIVHVVDPYTNFLKHEVILKCKTQVDVFTNRAKFIKDQFETLLEKNFFSIDRDVEISNNCGISIDNDGEWNVDIIFTGNFSLQLITLNINGSSNFARFIKKSCPYLIYASFRKLRYVEDDIMDDEIGIEDNEFFEAIPNSINNYNSGNESINKSTIQMEISEKNHQMPDFRNHNQKCGTDGDFHVFDDDDESNYEAVPNFNEPIFISDDEVQTNNELLDPSNLEENSQISENNCQTTDFSIRNEKSKANDFYYNEESNYEAISNHESISILCENEVQRNYELMNHAPVKIEILDTKSRQKNSESNHQMLNVTNRQLESEVDTIGLHDFDHDDESNYALISNPNESSISQRNNDFDYDDESNYEAISNLNEPISISDNQVQVKNDELLNYMPDIIKIINTRNLKESFEIFENNSGSLKIFNVTKFHYDDIIHHMNMTNTINDFIKTENSDNNEVGMVN